FERVHGGPLLPCVCVRSPATFPRPNKKSISVRMYRNTPISPYNNGGAQILPSFPAPGNGPPVLDGISRDNYGHVETTRPGVRGRAKAARSVSLGGRLESE